MTADFSSAAPLRLSPHLTLVEFTATAHRQFLDQQSTPPAEVLVNGRRFAIDVFEPARALVGAMRVSSGYRCPELNAAVGGKEDSLHQVGLAADLEPLECRLVEAFEQIIAIGSGVPFDEAILEFGSWIHLQAPRHGGKPRRLASMNFGGAGERPYDPTDKSVLALKETTR